jgi:hypothetical protein
MPEEFENQIEKEFQSIYQTGFKNGTSSAYESIKKVFIQISKENDKDNFSTKEIIDVIETCEKMYFEMIKLRIEADKEGL